jgi:hypothetical protein
MTISLYCVLGIINAAYAGTPMTERIAVEAGVKAEVSKDLALPYNPLEGLSGRTCLDGRPVADFQGDIVELWANLECPYCGIQEPVLAQRNNPDMCIVVRHIPTKEYGESLKKALSYEALKRFSINAANLFWDSVLPKTTLGIPAPYEAALLMAFQEAAISPEKFAETLTKDASELVSQDIFAAQGRISSTPTYILEGIRFTACDFAASVTCWACIPEAVSVCHLLPASSSRPGSECRSYHLPAGRRR